MNSAEEVRRYLNYNKDTGELRWRITAGNRIQAGEVAGTIRSAGGIAIRIQGQTLQAHRLAWLHHHGFLNCGMQIIHIDGDKMNNRINNLRAKYSIKKLNQ